VAALAWAQHDVARDRTVRVGPAPLVRGVLEPVQSVAYGQATVWPFVLLSVVGGVAYWRRHLQIVRLRAALKRRVTVAASQARVAGTPEEAWVQIPVAARLFGVAQSDSAARF
jgi:hypothetical protein